jgi:hypothetical protein
LPSVVSFLLIINSLYSILLESARFIANKRIRNMKTLFAFLKIGVISVILACLSVLVTSGQELPSGSDDETAIRQVALDYIDGYYSGDVTRMERAIHPDLNKAAPRDLP